MNQFQQNWKLIIKLKVFCLNCNKDIAKQVTLKLQNVQWHYYMIKHRKIIIKGKKTVFFFLYNFCDNRITYFHLYFYFKRKKLPCFLFCFCEYLLLWDHTCIQKLLREEHRLEIKANTHTHTLREREREREREQLSEPNCRQNRTLVFREREIETGWKIWIWSGSR